MAETSDAVAVSAPGKVLFAGGFLVLDRQHTGLVFGLDARIHVHVQSWSAPSLENRAPQHQQRGPDEQQTWVLVQSPQFQEARWLYDVRWRQEADVGVRQETEMEGYAKGRNGFVETALRYALTYLAHVGDVRARRGGGVEITVLADDDYYSSSGDVSTEDVAVAVAGDAGRAAAAERRGFTNFDVRLSDAHKTGLGSSAALTTALVGALVAFYLPGRELRQDLVHNLAQAGHCAAQGKVGSGFDVAAAVYGSCLYRRFSPAVLERVGEPESEGFAERLHRCVEDLEVEGRWDVEVLGDRVKVPEGLLLLLCDVDCGSETPGMVRKMLAWRKAKPEEASVLWGGLQAGQEELCAELGRLSALPVEVQRKEGYKRLGDTISTVRSLVREMSVKSGVPVEPEVITELLDHCESVDGVIGGVAPGAGGYDAVALLVRNDPEVVKNLQRSLQGWKSKKDGAEIGNVRLLGVKQEKEGVKREDSGDSRYASWV